MSTTGGGQLGTWITQLRKGLLEFCILSILEGGEHYGYAIVERLKEAQVMSVSQGAVYPVLHRLGREGYLDSRVAASDKGPRRRYFSLTLAGRRRLAEMRDHWASLTRGIKQLTDGSFEGGDKR